MNVILALLLIVVIVVVVIIVLTLTKENKSKSDYVSDFLGKNNRCDDIGGSLNTIDSNPVNDPALTIYGCAGIQGKGGNLALCEGISACDGCTSDSEIVGKIQKYYGNTNVDTIDVKSSYYKDVEKIMHETTKHVNNMISNGYIGNLHKDNIQPSVMFDLDDTIWCTMGMRKNFDPPFKFDAQKFNDGAKKNQMVPIDAVVTFINFLNLNGIMAIFVTGRASDTNDITKTQVEKIFSGDQYWNGTDINSEYTIRINDPVKLDYKTKIISRDGVFFHDKDEGDTNQGAATLYKITARKYIEDKGLDNQKIKFIMSVGDQWSDSNGDSSGIKIKLPNPMYYIP